MAEALQYPRWSVCVFAVLNSGIADTCVLCKPERCFFIADSSFLVAVNLNVLFSVMVRVVDIFYGRQFYYCFWIKFNWPTHKKWSKPILKMKWQTPKLSPYICIWIIYFDVFSAAKRNGQIKCLLFFLSHLFALEILRTRYECENINRIKQYRIG